MFSENSNIGVIQNERIISFQTAIYVDLQKHTGDMLT